MNLVISTITKVPVMPGSNLGQYWLWLQPVNLSWQKKNLEQVTVKSGGWVGHFWGQRLVTQAIISLSCCSKLPTQYVRGTTKTQMKLN